MQKKKQNMSEVTRCWGLHDNTGNLQGRRKTLFQPERKDNFYSVSMSGNLTIIKNESSKGDIIN